MIKRVQVRRTVPGFAAESAYDRYPPSTNASVMLSQQVRARLPVSFRARLPTLKEGLARQIFPLSFEKRIPAVITTKEEGNRERG